jgi:uncharacterized protein (DUF1499 family)
MQALSWLLIALALGVVAVLAAARLSAFSGRPPEGLGLRDGKFKPPSKTPNSVSSQAALWPAHPQAAAAAIAPLALVGDGPATISRLAHVIESIDGARIVERKPDYLYAQFTTRLMRFVDDAEFWFDPVAGVVQVHSASRVGRKDFGVNRARIETLRARLAAA